MATSVIQERQQSVGVIAFASFIGTTIEWYDFFLYQTFAALVFNKLFFPTLDPLTGTLAAIGTNAAGFVARPLGGVLMGHFGDRIGRKSMLVFTLVLMGTATFLIGTLPTYEQIGPWAAVLLILLRVVQGFGVGGEWGGAVLMVIEHAPKGRRGFYGSWPQIGVPAGLLIANTVFVIFQRLPDEQFLSWGWRVPFLVSIVLVAIGLVIRTRVLETPAFANVKATQREARMPIVEVLRDHPKEVLLGIGARIAENGGFYIYSVFMLVYATQYAHMPRQAVLYGLLAASAIEIVAIPLWGSLTDRLGRRPVYLFGGIMTAVLAFPLFWMFDTASATVVMLAFTLVLVLAHAPMYATQGAFLPELFGTRVRYSGASLGAQISAVLAGGLAPFIAIPLTANYGSSAVALYIIGMAIVTIISVYVATETMHHDVDRH